MQSKIFRGPARYEEYQAWMTSESIQPLGIFCHSDRSLEIHYDPPEKPLPEPEKVLPLPARPSMGESRPLVMPYGYKQKGNSTSECALCA
jgi:hypothetical protein